MSMTFTKAGGAPDFTLPTSPALTDPPLTLLDLSLTLIDTQTLTEALRQGVERLAGLQQQQADLETEQDEPGESDSEDDVDQEAAQRALELSDAVAAAEAWVSDAEDRLAALSRWETGIQYLPELSNEAGLSVWIQGGTAGNENPKVQGSNQTPFAWYDAFTVIGRDDRSLFGWPATDFASRAMRARRALSIHRSWQIEEEFWNGAQVPTNYHLTASPNTPLSTPNVRTISAWPNPVSPPGVVLGTALTIESSLSYLDQMLAASEAGTGMVHATPFLVQQWMRYFNYIRDNDGKVYTVNHNLIVPGYGYSGMGPDQADIALTDVVTNGTSTITSATGFGADTEAYLGRPLVGASMPTGAIIGALASANSATVYAPDPISGIMVPTVALNSAAGNHLTVKGIGGRRDFAGYQWAYCTEQTYSMLGDENVYPSELNQGSPLTTVQNSVDVRAEQPAGIVTNRILRGAVYVNIFDAS